MESDDAAGTADGDKNETVKRRSGHRAIESQKLLIFDQPMARSPDDPIFRYSLLSLLLTRFNAFFTVPRSIMIFSCSSVMA
jgi:hypothetical protein